MEKALKYMRFAVLAALLAMAGCNSNAGSGDNGIPGTPPTPQPFNDVTATELVGAIKIGWNLGNSLDADGGETAWGNPKTTRENIIAIKNAGFNTIRIPVSWSNATDSSYNLRTAWLARVVEVVNYAAENNMYIILNTHHDEKLFTFMNSNAAKGQKAFKRIWEQIADTFKNYDHKLIFEGLNEPRTKGSAAEWNGGTAEERNNLNTYYQIFVDVVRTSGGNNNKRFLLINPYAASGGTAAMNGLTLPTDSATDKLIVSFHNYAPNSFCFPGGVSTWSASSSSDTSPINDPITNYYNKFVVNGIPVIIGEFGAMNKNNESTRAAWAQYYVNAAWGKGMKCVWWDNGATSGTGELFGLLNRKNNTIVYPSLRIGLMNGCGTPTPLPPMGD